jgi:hypothetical protein
MLFEGRGLLQGLPMPSPWLKMIHLSGQIYKKLTPAQKIKLVEMGVLQPDFEDILIDLFDKYLAEEPELSDLRSIAKSTPESMPNYSQYKGLLLKIHPAEIRSEPNMYNAFKVRVKKLMDKTFPDTKISNVTLYHPNYSTLYEYWRKIHKIFQPSKK